MRALSRREHGFIELQRKLAQHFNDTQIIQEELTHLVEQGYLSDQRFTESFIRYCSNNGKGPQRIQQELKQRGINDNLIEECIAKAEIDWFELAKQVRCKRYGDTTPKDFQERAKQMRFLQYRGFTTDQIKYSLE